MIKAGERLFYVANNGNVQPVSALTDEANGVVSIKAGNGQPQDVGSFDLFRTQMAANRAAVTKGSPANQTTGLFVRPPR